MSRKVLITGANRGIGLALVKEFQSRGDQVYAGCRTPDRAEELNALAGKSEGTVCVFRLDVTRPESVAAASQFVWSQTDALDILINNAGIFPEPSADVTLNELEMRDCRDAFDTNVLGVARVTRAMLPLLEKGAAAKVANITSGVGSISDKTRPGYYAYGTSKAALNYFTRAIAAEMKGRGPIVVAINPGWVKTDMGGPEGQLKPSQSATGIAEVIDKLTPADNSCWFNWDGKKHESW